MQENLNERLQEANRRIDEMLPDLWEKAEQNLNFLESEYMKKKGEKSS